MLCRRAVARRGRRDVPPGADRQPGRDRLPGDGDLPAAGGRDGGGLFRRGCRRASTWRWRTRRCGSGRRRRRRAICGASAIVEAALASGAEAIHPGYGFLSENPEFVEAVAAAGLVFIGPSAAAIRAMGLKDAAKALMAAAGRAGGAGVSRGGPGRRAAGGGGGGDRLSGADQGGGGRRRQGDAAGRPGRRTSRAALAAARGEARAAFGNDAVLVEKYVTAPRHVEIQVFGDGRGRRCISSSATARCSGGTRR